MFAVSSMRLVSQTTCPNCDEWLTTENIGTVTLPSNHSIALGFHYDGPNEDYKRMMNEIWVSQMFYHELAPTLLEDRHLLVVLRTAPSDSVEFSGLRMCIADHLEVKTINATVLNVGTCLTKKDGVKDVGIRISIDQSAYEPHYHDFPDLKYLEFFVVLENPGFRSVNVTYDLQDVAVVRTPHDYVSIFPSLTIMSIGILLLLAATASSLPAYATFLLAKLFEYLPHDVGSVAWRKYRRVTKWALYLNLLLFVVPFLEIWGVLYRVGLWPPSIRLAEGDVYPPFLLKHDYVNYLLLTEGDFVARAHIVKGLLQLSLALLPLHVAILLFAMADCLAYLNRIKLNRIAKAKSYTTTIISLSFLMLSPILFLFTAESELARILLTSSPTALTLDASVFEKLRSLVIGDAWEIRLIYEPTAGYAIAVGLLLVSIISWVATAAVLFRTEDEAVPRELLSTEKARFRQNLIMLVGTWALVQAVLFVFSRNLTVNLIYSFLLALIAPCLGDFLKKRHLALHQQDAE